MCYGGSEQKPPLLYRSHVSSRAVSDTVSMATLGDIQLSLLSGQQQTSLSAAAFNFDFTLVKVAPPKEYEGLGKCLSVRRKAEAEEGSLHTVARKLGALFAGELPAVPNLISAYGERASEISLTPKPTQLARELIVFLLTMSVPMQQAYGRQRRLEKVPSQSTCWVACLLASGVQRKLFQFGPR